MLTRTILTIILVGFALTPVAKADTYSHIDGLAVQLTQYARLLDREFSLHYRHTPKYGHLRNDTRNMIRLADHMHDVAHHHGSLAHLQSDLRQLDRLFHHIEELVDDIEHDAIHSHDFHGHFGGHIHGDTHHVRRILRSMEDTLHHLMEDVAELARLDDHHDHGHEVRVIPTPRVIPAPPQIRFFRPGFSIQLGP
jgi:hypothetical protein